MINSSYDIAIVGSGIAGSIAALRLSELRPDLSIVMISKGAITECSSQLAQGGIALPCADVEDDLDRHVHDTLVAGNMRSDPKAVREILLAAPRLVAYLEGHGVAFDRTSDDHYHYALEGGHHRPRVIHTSDATGATIMSTLHTAIAASHSISVREGMRLTAIRRIDADQWQLEIDHSASNRALLVHAHHVILAMGGSGNAFGYSSNLPTAIGDAVELARSLRLPVVDLQWMQFHPTVLVSSGTHTSRPLITEALRGAGAYLVNNIGERFMERYDKRGELAPRDVVSSAMLQEMEITATDRVYLDCRHLPTGVLHQQFPGFMDLCSREYFDPSRDLIPVRPGAHYQCGGIEAGLDGTTSLPGLFAIGECARTGMHGSNRLASNSLLEAGVMALNAAERISGAASASCAATTEAPSIERLSPSSVKGADLSINVLLHELKTLLQHAALDDTKLRYVDAVSELAAEIEKRLTSESSDRDTSHDARTLSAYARVYAESIGSQQGTVMTV
ncbi:MAG: FAD-binding protein [Ignavibacteria bacterium]|nr:FAD-binding protein [Ignavibacteria bacterium]MBK6418949.1 FAD-binding protein [Ignavibacteria bacterium]MBK6760362.1 FAD-binding protein [Ignavibacteria bacterium]MBK7033887.1 FAD-binding protein [Ignavibacteria bacterium]MBK7186622.1 FAD-binding protein [Ignavibacteria bacterium]